MTEEFKKNVMSYLTGTFQEQENYPNIPHFKDIERKNTQVVDQLEEEMPNGFNQVGYLLLKDTNGNTNGYFITYGAFYTTSEKTTQNGYIALFNSNFELLKVFKTYTTGTSLSVFRYLNVDDTGNIYGIDYSSNRLRFILLNNISAMVNNEYRVVLKNSYFLQGNVANSDLIFKVNKAPGVSRYLIVGNRSTNIYITEFVLNVGAENEWKDYIYSGTIPSNFSIKDLYTSWDENNNLTMSLKLQTRVNEIYRIDELKKNPTSEDLTYSTILDDLRQYFFQNSYVSGCDVRTINDKKFYFVLYGAVPAEENMITGAIKTNLYDNGNISTVLEYKPYVYTGYTPENISFITEFLDINGTMFLYFMTNKNNPSSVANTIWSLYSVLITEKEETTSDIIVLGETTSGDLSKFNTFVVTNEFNLYKIYFLLQDFDSGNYMLLYTYTIYNKFNYNGYAHREYNSMVPNSVELYDDNGIIFARNLYNKTIYGYTTTSIVQIPNTMLNEIEITTQKLLSKQNNVLIEDTNSIEKNIYETVYLNFINSLIIKDMNEDHNEINVNASSLFNYDISQNAQYNNIKMKKYRINYEDGTSRVGEINDEDITIDGTEATIKLNIYVEKLINNIELISNNEYISYVKIDCSVMEIEKYYDITQCVEII